MALTAGSIAFVGFNADGNDNIAFVALTDIAAGEVIIFEDNEWNGTGFVDINEGAFSWTATSLVPAGTIIRINDIGGTGTITANTGTATTPVAGRGTNRGIAAGDETIYAYQGTPGTPTTFLTAIANGGFSASNGLLTNTGLTVGVNAIDLSTLDDDADIAIYTGSRTGQTSFSDYLSLINNSANWVAQDGTGDQSIDGITPDVPFSEVPFTAGSTLPTVNLSVSANAGTEVGQTVITVTATASTAVSGNQTVALGVTGTNITADDFALSNAVITILDGQTSGSVTFTVADDLLPEGNETAVLTISNPSAGVALGGATQQSILITDNDAPPAPIVSIAATDANAAELGTTVNPGSFTVTRTGDPTAALTVTYTVGGTATNGSDYTRALTGSVVIPAGQASATITITPVNDGNITEGTETVTLTLVDGATYDLNASASATVNIADNTTGSLRKVGAATGTGAEIPAFDPGSDRLFVVAGTTVEYYSVSNAGALTLVGSLTPGFTPPVGTVAVPNSVAVKNGIVAVAYAIENTTTDAQSLGRVGFFSTDGTFLNSVEVGFLPDMVTFTPDGTKVMTANEGEPNSYGQADSFDPEGSISIIDLASGVVNASVQNATFTSFNSQIDALKAAGVRITGPGSSVAQDLEPEYIAFSGDGTKAYVTLQENNALAIVDIATATVTDIKPLGLKNHSLPGNGLDASDRDGGTINIQNWPVFGMYQPDAIASFTVNGQTYFVTANEGDARDYTGFSEEIRVNSSSYVLDPTTFPNAAALKLDANLGRLQLTRATGDTDGDGDFDQIQALGSRSFSIWDANGNQVFDSGDQLEQITAVQVPGIYNSDGNFASPNFDTRSDNKGPEPEGVVVGVVNNRTYAFIGLERTGDVIVYDVTTPTSPQFVEYINTPEDVGPEGLTFVSAADSPTGRPLLVTANEVSRTVAVFEFIPQVRISTIQGTQHVSPLAGQGVRNVPGIVTAIASNGFYLQDPSPDTNDATSEGIFVFTGSTSPILAARTVGEAILVSGTVSEFRPGNNNPNNLTITQISNNTTVQPLSVSAWTTAPTTAIAPTILGNGGRIPPNAIINNDAVGGNVENPATPFDPAEDGIDFYESLEGMVVQINNAIATSPTANFGTSEEIWVLADNGANATGRTARGGSLITPTDFNPERIQIDDLINGTVTLPEVNVGAQFGTITGVVSYDFNNYEVLVPTAPTVVQPSSLTKEVTPLTGTTDQLTIATFNVENLGGNAEQARFDAIATAIVGNLLSPDILSLEEIQDNNGATNDSEVDATLTFNRLIAAIAAAGGPTYEFRQLNPVDDQDGGQPGGNIRVGFLFNPDRVDFVDGTLQRLTDTNLADGDAFQASRKPLVGTFTFNGQDVTVIGNHFNSKGGDQPLFGPNQPPTLTTEAQRNQQATIVRTFVEGVLSSNANANVVVAGDLNDFEFSNPLTILEQGGLNTLVETLPANERYTYNFQGNAQVLDHILVSNNLLANLDAFDVVHINSEFADQVSDHDPVIARFNLPVPNQAPTAIAFLNTVTTLAEDASTSDRIQVADIAITDDGLGTNVLSLSGADAGFFELDGNALFLKANTTLNFEAQFNYAVTVEVDDVTVGGTPDVSAVFNLAITNVNEAPVAVADSASTTDTQSVAIAVLTNDSDPDAGDTLAIQSFTNPANGTVVQNTDNTFTYTPTVGFVGNDSFTYVLRDAAGLTSTATVSLNVTLGTNSIIGTNGNDNLVGTSRIDVIQGLAGNDTLNGGAGADQLIGGLGNDQYIVDAGDLITENANEGTDTVRASIAWTLEANLENLSITGNAAVNGTGNELNNVLTGNNASNTLRGLEGNDTLDGKGGLDTLIGGLGNDRYLVDNAGDVVTEKDGEGTDTVVASVSWSLQAHVENLTLAGSTTLSGTGNDLNNVLQGNNFSNTLLGLDGNDSIDGNSGNDTLMGGEGDDSLFGDKGNDSLQGGVGNDRLDGGVGGDTMAGNEGNDLYIVDSLSDVVTELEGEGTDLVQSSISYTLSDFVENLVLTGTSNINGTGNDLNNVITGNKAINTLRGGDGDDTLIGNGGNDTLIGGRGNDVLIGGNGSDLLTGGEGSDRFAFNAFEERTDTITDFNTSEDLLDLDTVFDYLGSTPITSAFLRFSQSGSRTLVQIDQNGSTGGASFSTLVALDGVNATDLAIGTNVLV